MEIAIEELFISQLKKCRVAFQQKFRRIYKQLKVVDEPTEVKNIFASPHNKNFHKLHMEESGIGLMLKNKKCYILFFLYNQYFE